MAHVSKNIIEYYSKLDEFRKLEKYTDVTIKCRETSFQCHRVALALACPYFDSMFSLLCRGENTTSVELPDDIRVTTFREVLQFIYTGDVIINSENVFDLIVASDTLGLGNLEDLCIQYLKKGAVFKNIRDILSFAYAKTKHILLNVLVDHVIKYLEPFLECEEFLELPFRFLSRVLTNPKFTLSSIGIKTLEKAVLSWINHSREERSQYLNQFLELLNCGKYESSSLITFELNNLDACVELTQKYKVIDYESLISSSRRPLNVFVNHRARQILKQNWVQVFKMDKDFKCFSICEIAQDLNLEHTMKCVAVNNSFLYSLNHYRCTSLSTYHAKFSVSTSIDGQTEKYLNTPPNASHLFEMCEIHDSVLFYDKDEGSDNIYWYNKEKDMWTRLPSLDKEKQMACMTTCNNTHLVYLIGGEYNGSETNSVHTYDFRSGKWQNLPATKFKRQAAACCLYKDKVYVSGGLMQNFFEVYDPVAGRWKELQPTTRKLTHHVMVPHENALWVVGGIEESEQRSTVNHLVDKYDPVLNEWYTSSILKYKYKTGRHFEVLDAVVFKPYW